ncbi:phage scaffolding protein [Paenibacillus alvei]|uniref:Phage scaffolding protein n=1 Tax=Paenibacillus alvei TaxID=44250 RepID=A0ABT4GW51_PAEAL|nr:phage scaffolding protein [Paenibacillus alvei]MCY9760920.1 phage scaffolding protein [Paenibacillus alvei]MCY9768840.1 phage scaffolding protein [Paenibacillus alvei]
MNKEQFIALGFTEEQAEKAAAASQEELKGFVPKSRFDEVNEAKKQAEKDQDTLSGQLEELKKSAEASDGLKQQITTLQAENQNAKDQYESQLKDLKLNNAISAALNGKVHNEKVVTGLINREKLIVGDDGKIVGLEEQLTKLKSSDAYLFKDDSQQQQTPPGFRVGGGGNPNPPAATASLKDAIAAHFQK